ncbi:hypothetical protein GCK72_004949 [Caenorhabditis remanei]|uniref:JmjC domain-containing protein n=1 Tax=Caenorhabditis remanei TaxID=31234 RepID=A0A6A5HB45_CAERE|nr:hypothetical protein GCK72_004949 [Caenorhabditis remanei]KAF1764998.1 hypothetical protein GCK72_004949 [Caenorhabditis remanei]
MNPSPPLTGGETAEPPGEMATGSVQPMEIDAPSNGQLVSSSEGSEDLPNGSVPVATKEAVTSSEDVTTNDSEIVVVDGATSSESSEDSKKSNGSGVVAIDDLKKDESPMPSENAMTNGSDRVSVEESTGGSDVMVSNGEKTDEQTKSNGHSATSSERVSVDQETHSETSEQSSDDSDLFIVCEEKNEQKKEQPTTTSSASSQLSPNEYLRALVSNVEEKKEEEPATSVEESRESSNGDKVMETDEKKMESATSSSEKQIPEVSMTNESEHVASTGEKKEEEPPTSSRILNRGEELDRQLARRGKPGRPRKVHAPPCEVSAELSGGPVQNLRNKRGRPSMSTGSDESSNSVSSTSDESFDEGKSPKPKKLKLDGTEDMRSHNRKKAPDNRVPILKMKPWDVHPYSREWMAASCLLSAHEELQLPMSEEAAKKIEKWTGPVKERHCYSYEFPLDEMLPMPDEFRGLEKKMAEMVQADAIPMPNSATTRPNDQPAPSDSTPTRKSGTPATKKSASNPRKKEIHIPKSIHFTGSPYLDSLNSTSDEIIEKAKLYQKTGINHVYADIDNEKNMFLFDEKSDLVDKELKVFAKYGHEDNLESRGYLPVATYTVETGSDEEMAKVEKIINGTSMCLIKNIGNVIGLDADQFSVEKFKEIAKDYDLTVLRMIPQPTSSNFPTHGKSIKKEQLSSKWRSNHYKHKVAFKEFAKYITNLRKQSTNVYLAIIEHPEHTDDIMKQFATFIQTELTMENHGCITHSQATLIAFGTNMDLDDYKKFPVQAENVAKFPHFLAPDGTRTLLGYTKESIPGLNKPQLYLKVPGVRTGAHLENSGLGSVNHSLGPSTSCWYGVPLEFVGQLQKMAKCKLGMNLERGQIYKQEFWPFEGDLLQAKIPVQKFLQRKGDMVFVGPGTFHWVQANGFAHNISWNVGQPTFIQLAVAGIMHDNYVANKDTSIMPIETILWEMIREKAPMDLKMKKLVKAMLMRSLTKAQMELDFLDAHGLQVEDAATNPYVHTVERCWKCRECLNNFVGFGDAKVPTPDTNTFEIINHPHCFQCLPNSRFKLQYFTFYQHSSMEELKELHDRVLREIKAEETMQ